MLILIASNGIFTYFIDEQVKIVNNDRILTLYGELISFLEYVSVNSMYLKADGSYGTDFKQEILNSLAGNLNIEDDIMDEESMWKGCGRISRIFNEKYLDVYELDGEFVAKQLTLHDFIQNFKTVASDFIKKLENGEDNVAELNYMVNNAMIYINKQLKADYQDIETCLNDWKSDFNFTKDMLVILQLTILYLYFILICYKAYKVIHATNLVWKKISETTFIAFYDIRNRCINRLTTYLEVSEEEANLFYEYNRVQKNTFSVKFLQVWPYIWRILIFILSSTLYFVLISLVGSMRIEELITDYNSIKDILYQKNFFMLETNFWTVASTSNLIDENIVKFYFDQTIDSYSKVDSHMLEDRYKKFYSSDYDFLIDKYSTNITYGLVNTNKATLLDSFYITSTKDTGYMDKYSRLMNELKSLNEVIISDVSRTGKSIINLEFQYTIMFIVLYGVFCIVLFLGVYLVFFERKINHLRHMKELTKMFVLNLKDPPTGSKA